MRWYFVGLAVLMLLVPALAPAECHAKGIFSFFNPEVTTPVTVQPVNSDITGGMKATITLGSLGSVITSHLALIIFGFLLYAAIRRLGEGYHARIIGWRERRSIERIERQRLWNADNENRRSARISFFHPHLVSESMAHFGNRNTVKVDVNTAGLSAILDEMKATAARMEAAQQKGKGART